MLTLSHKQTLCGYPARGASKKLITTTVDWGLVTCEICIEVLGKDLYVKVDKL